MTNETVEWDWDSWLEIRGPYDNVVFRSVFWDGVFRVSLAMPIEKGEEWRWSTTFVPNWYMNMDETWDTSLSGPYPSTNAPHYFYRIFSGSSFMAAYELRILYRYGVVAYINGIEVYRDNLPVGPILPTTRSATSYVYYQYRGTIRNGYEVSSVNNVLAIEVHTSSSSSIEFDAWLAMYASSDTFNGNQACYPVVPTSAIWSDGYNMGRICDFDSSSGITVNAFSPGLNYVEFSIPTAQITSFSILIYQSMPYYTNMQWQAYDIGSGQWSDYYVSSPITVVSQLYVDVTMGDSTSPNSNKVRFYPLKANRVPTDMYEYIPRVCHLTYSTEQKIPQFKEQYELKKDEFVFIHPTNWNNTSTCTSTPALPDGLSFSACAIQGTPTALQEETTFTVFIYDVMGTKYRIVKLAIIEPTPNDGDKGPGIMIIILIVVVVVIVVIVLVLIVRHITKKQQKELPVKHSGEPSKPSPVVVDPSIHVINQEMDIQSQTNASTIQMDPVPFVNPSTVRYDQSTQYGNPTTGFDQSTQFVDPTTAPYAQSTLYGNRSSTSYSQTTPLINASTGYDQSVQYNEQIQNSLLSNPAYVMPPATPGYSVVFDPRSTPNNNVIGTPATLLRTPSNPTDGMSTSSHPAKVSVLVRHPPTQPSTPPQDLGRSMFYSNPDTEYRVDMNSEVNSQHVQNPVVSNGRAPAPQYMNWESMTEEQRANVK